MTPADRARRLSTEAAFHRAAAAAYWLAGDRDLATAARAQAERLEAKLAELERDQHAD
jgi:hypothetical protein